MAEEQNVTRASQRLHITQPSLSRQVRDLEEELGVTLLQRTAKAVRLTEAGRIFLEESRAVLVRADEAAEAVRALGGKKAKQLQVGYAPTPAAEILPQVLRSFQKTAPLIRLVMHDMTLEEMIAGVRDGSLDAAIGPRPAGASMRGLRFVMLRRYSTGVCVPPGHRFTRKESVSIREILKEPLISYDRKAYPDYCTFLADALGIAEARLHVQEECDGALSLIAAVEAGRGVALAMESIGLLAGRRIVFVPIDPVPPRSDVGLIHSDLISGQVKLLIETARQCAAV